MFKFRRNNVIRATVSPQTEQELATREMRKFVITSIAVSGAIALVGGIANGMVKKIAENA